MLFRSAVLPTKEGPLYVYVYPAQTDNGVFPLGGDGRYLISADGNTIIEDRRMHDDVLMFDMRQADASGSTAGWHTHVLSDVPEDTDVFYALSIKPAGSQYIGTRSGFYYRVKEDGTILPVSVDEVKARFPGAKIGEAKPKP